ncbi:MAG: hypothetical protein KC619_23535 [Myxococcales bacterium]|nr:hypothetical protein [Myxococcales bacterium]
MPPMDGGGTDAGPGDAAVPALDAGMASWGARECDVTVRYAPPSGAGSVRIAGEFTDWEASPIDLRDDDGDGVFEVTLMPNARLVSGELYAYKLIVDGNWILDPNERYRKYVDACLNSALQMPACDAGPEILAGELTTNFEDGSARTRITILTAEDGAAPETIAMSLDGAALPDGAWTLDATAGAFDVAVSGLGPGRHVLSVRVTDAMGRDAEPVDLPFWLEAEPFEWQDATMYMIVVDRFANGDRSNDRPVGAPVEYPADFHGGDLQGATEVMRSGYFDDLGIDAIWLSPINQQAEGHFEGRDGPQRFAGYHGYWPIRGREVEPRFGGNAALHAFVDEAHAHGIRVLFDLINNQVHDQHEYYRDHDGWFRTGCVCGVDAGCGWSERPLDCLFASYLPDINWRIPEAEHQFIDDAVYWVEEFGIDGFRIDAVKHVETNSIVNLRSRLHQRFEQGGHRLYLVGETAVGQWDSADYGCGETYSDGYAWIDAYVGDNALDGQFDFPTHHQLQDGLVTDRMTYTAVDGVIREAMSRYSPEGLHVRFLGTHDSNRMASRAAFDPAQGCRWPDGGGCPSLPGQPTDPAVFGRLRRAFTILYTTPGIPFLYYGDEIGMPGGNDPDNRRDMVWTGDLSGLAMGETSTMPVQEALRSHMRALGQARADSVALRRGRRVPLHTSDDLYVYAYTHDSGDLAIVAVNRGGAVTDMRVDVTPSMVASVTSLEAVAGTGTATLAGTRVGLTLEAGGAVVFRGR